MHLVIPVDVCVPHQELRHGWQLLLTKGGEKAHHCSTITRQEFRIAVEAISLARCDQAPFTTEAPVLA
eukprot:scaffold93294_cov27-Tisochrysis_lutea.AAC.2